MKAYQKRLKQIDLVNCSYKYLHHSYLNDINRCKLFTELYEFCIEKDYHVYKKNLSEPFKFIVFDIFGKKAVATYLSKEITGSVRHSENLTMTEFRSRKGKLQVYDAIKRWEPTSTSRIDSAAGKMHIINYPILLRVQTEYDKVYGKE